MEMEKRFGAAVENPSLALDHPGYLAQSQEERLNLIERDRGGVLQAAAPGDA